MLVLGLELGLRHDGGNAETGTGVELDGVIVWTDTAMASSWRRACARWSRKRIPAARNGARTVGCVKPPNASRQDLSFSLAPDGGFAPERRLEGGPGYGLTLHGSFTRTPNASFGFSDTARDYRVSWQLTLAVPNESGFEVILGARLREAANGNKRSGHIVMLKDTDRLSRRCALAP